jgi:hypothetical protein
MKAICRAMHKIHSRRTRFVYDAYFYAEKKLGVTHLRQILWEIKHTRDFQDTVLDDYTLDVLAGRAKPQTQKPVRRLR